jgi:hypothetical protein
MQRDHLSRKVEGLSRKVEGLSRKVAGVGKQWSHGAMEHGHLCEGSKDVSSDGAQRVEGRGGKPVEGLR